MEEKILKILESIQKDISGMKSDIKDLKTQTTENTQILKALEHSSQVNKAEHDKMAIDIAKIQGDIKGIKKDLLFVEEATAKNWRDIAGLKAVK